jgi:hypothetical protein
MGCFDQAFLHEYQTPVNKHLSKFRPFSAEVCPHAARLSGPPLEEVCTVVEPAGPPVHGSGKLLPAQLSADRARATPDCRPGEIALLVKGVEINVNFPQLLQIVAVAGGDEFQGVEAGLLGRRAAPHILDDRARTVDVDGLLAAARRAGRADLVVN